MYSENGLFWRGKPVRLLVLAGRLRSRMQSQRAIGVGLQILVFGSERETLQRIGIEEVVLVGDGAKMISARGGIPRHCILG